jgi:general stress protein 26
MHDAHHRAERLRSECMTARRLSSNSKIWRPGLTTPARRCSGPRQTTCCNAGRCRVAHSSRAPADDPSLIERESWDRTRNRKIVPRVAPLWPTKSSSIASGRSSNAWACACSPPVLASGLRARLLEVRPDRDDGRIWFVTDLHSGKEQEIESEDEVGLVFIDAREKKAYLSITARAQVLRDHAKAAAIWKSTDNVWWRGPDDPNVCVLRVTPITAELWDGQRARPLPRSNSPRRG